ncbi:MAG TPA: hypothetical protein VNO30_46605 [Kofleriaceae bacterium]|nr:hypothetical protein [Kofleriaceae bacterium]
MMTQLKYLATTLLLLVGCTTEVPASDPASGIDDTVTSEPDQAGDTDNTANIAPSISRGDVNASDDRPGQGEPCPDDVCAQGLTCLKYYGFGGEAGGLLTSCEIRCDRAGQCPAGQSCITIYDGPGQVCRPNRD